MPYYQRRQFNRALLPKTYKRKQIEKEEILEKNIKRYSANIPCSMMKELVKLNFESKNQAMNALIRFSLDRETKPNETYFKGAFKVFTGQIESSSFVKLLDRRGKYEPLRMVLTRLITQEAINDFIRQSKVPNL